MASRKVAAFSEVKRLFAVYEYQGKNKIEAI